MTEKNDYFRLVSWWALATVPYGLTLVTIGAVKPDLARSMTLSFLLPAFNLLQDRLVRIALITWTLHLAEAFFSRKLCKSRGITDGDAVGKWTIQTFFYGFFSLYHLYSYDPKKNK